MGEMGEMGGMGGRGKVLDFGFWNLLWQEAYGCLNSLDYGDTFNFYQDILG